MLSWTWNDLRVSYLGEYIGGLTSPVSFLGSYEQDVDSQFYHDIVVEYNFGMTGTTVQAGITNFTDEAPPYIDLAFNARLIRLPTVYLVRVTTSGSDNLSNPCLKNPASWPGFLGSKLALTHDTAAADAAPSGSTPVR
ncbi:MAG: hypothetical protein CM15mP74_12350 [Halieaceae bacterium]|nr:MAG: hypothetical protein CM15mP74_12350 [Halieaceae bacterium]